MDTIYVVFGECGEYSDKRIWPVIAFATEADALAHAAKAQDRDDVLGMWIGTVDNIHALHADDFPKNEFDANNDHYETRWGETEYTVHPVPFGQFAVEVGK